MIKVIILSLTLLLLMGCSHQSNKIIINEKSFSIETADKTKEFRNI